MGAFKNPQFRNEQNRRLPGDADSSKSLLTEGARHLLSTNAKHTMPLSAIDITAIKADLLKKLETIPKVSLVLKPIKSRHKLTHADVETLLAILVDDELLAFALDTHRPAGKLEPEPRSHCLATAAAIPASDSGASTHERRVIADSPTTASVNNGIKARGRVRAALRWGGNGTASGRPLLY